jgi:S-adenosylmethionine hydrolase
VVCLTFRIRWFLAAITLLGCVRDEPRDPATVLFLTDFGVRDGAVALCKGVMWEIAPQLRIVDVSHEVPPYDIETAGEVLEQAVAYYPRGTVAVAVVDPGVGSTRKSVAILTKKGHVLVGPDNGLFTLVMEAEGLDRAVELTNKRYQREGDASYTFHGRDIFSPVAAHLAAGVPLDSLGPSVVPMRLDVRRAHRTIDAIDGVVRYVEDPYGNVVTNIPAALLDSAGLKVGDSLDVSFPARTMRLPWRRTFSDVPRGQNLAVMHERGLLSFSINQGDFATKYAIKRKDGVLVRRVRAP